MMLNRFFFPGFIGSTAILAEKKEDGKDKSKSGESCRRENKDKPKYSEHCRRICKRSELPIYSSEDPKPKKVTYSEEPGTLEKGISAARKEVWVITDQVKDATDKIKDSLGDAGKKSSVFLDYLKEDSNVVPRIGAIALSGLTGYIFGLRGGIFRRLTYGSIGALGMTSLCYPKETAEYSQDILANTKRGIAISYNFIFGVKPDEEMPQFLEMPSSLSDLWSMTSNMGNYMKNMFSSEK